MPIRWARAYVQVARADSLVRNSLYMMSSTVATALLGYVFWIVAAHAFDSSQIGIASAVISLCSTVSLFTYLGPAALLVERLHAFEQSRAWTVFLDRLSVTTGVATAVVAAVAVPLIAHSRSYGPYFGVFGAAVLAVIGAVAWTLVNMYSSAFVAARRADGVLAVQGICSLLKVLLLVPLCLAGFGAVGIVLAWVASSVIGVAAGAGWLLPRMGLGKSSSPGRRRGAGKPLRSTPSARHTQQPWNTPRPRRTPHPRHEQPQQPILRDGDLWHLLGQHITSVGGQATPLILPILVVLRLGEGPNAHFYITWMIGSVFFMVSPSISNALFAESVRASTGLRTTVVKAFRVTSFLLIPAMVLVIAAGQLILGIFGREYVSAGYGLLIVLAISAVPDSVSNVAVAVCRATNRIGYSAGINVGILVFAAGSSWLLMPRLGLLGAGLGWLAAQVLGALASVPAFLQLDGGQAA